MAKRRRIAYIPSRIKNLDGFKKIIKKAEQMDMPHVPEESQYMSNTVGYGAVDKEIILEPTK